MHKNPVFFKLKNFDIIKLKTPNQINLICINLELRTCFKRLSDLSIIIKIRSFNFYFYLKKKNK